MVKSKLQGYNGAQTDQEGLIFYIKYYTFPNISLVMQTGSLSLPLIIFSKLEMQWF